MKNIAGQLHNEISKVCPIVGVSIGDENDKATWRIDFKNEATKEQKQKAMTILNSFVYEEIIEKSLEDRVADLELKVKQLTNGI